MRVALFRLVFQTRQKFERRGAVMSIQKKSLISTLKTAKKANVAAAVTHDEMKGEKVASMRVNSNKQISPRGAVSFKQAMNKSTLKNLKNLTLKVAKGITTKATY